MKNVHTLRWGGYDAIEWRCMLEWGGYYTIYSIIYYYILYYYKNKVNQLKFQT